MREWEEEQVKLDRDWYTGAEEGTLAGDEEHNPLAQYEDLSVRKNAEIAKRQIVRSIFRIIFVCDPHDFDPRKKSQHDKHNM